MFKKKKDKRIYKINRTLQIVLRIDHSISESGFSTIQECNLAFS